VEALKGLRQARLLLLPPTTPSRWSMPGTGFNTTLTSDW